MYKLSGKLKTFSIIFLVLGAIGIVYSFISAPSSIDEAKEIVTQQQEQEQKNEFVDQIHESGFSEKAMEANDDGKYLESETYMEKALHQLKARPYAGVFIAGFFFLMLALGALVFHAIQYVSEAGWSPLLFRVFEGVTSYVLPGSIIVALIIALAGTNFFPWMNADLVAEDEVLQIKSVYLNKPFFFIRMILYLVIWNAYRHFQVKNSLAQSDVTDYTYRKKNYNISVWFLVIFGVTESMMGWDWFMSLTPHWYSALFSWYIFASMFVTGITTIALVVISLQKRGYLEFINDSHLHDLAKYIFAFSIFWCYLWFAQFMLIWYANIPEEASYFVMLMQNYKLPFIGMLFLNFIVPFVFLMNTDFKRVPWLVEFVGLVLLAGHYVAIYLSVVPAIMGTHGSFGIPEIAGILFFLGLFIFIVGTGLGKENLKPEGDPYIKESENFQY